MERKSVQGPDVPGYEDLRRVGAGGFSSVYRAYEPAFDRVVAIKVLSLTVADPAAQRRFRRECQLMGRLGSHPHIVTVFASGVLPDDRPYIVMEYLDGGTLSSRAPLPEPEVMRHGILVGAALASIHAAGVIHRDVKPQNIFLSSYGHPVLGDFGVSDVVQGGEISNPMAMSPFYAAPETFNGLPSPASDQYSLAATLYALLAGRAPFQGDRTEPFSQILLRKLSDPPPTLPTGSASPDLRAILDRGLAKTAEDRFPDVITMVRALQDAQATSGLPVTATVGDSTEPADFPAPPGASARIDTVEPLGGHRKVPVPPEAESADPDATRLRVRGDHDQPGSSAYEDPSPQALHAARRDQDLEGTPAPPAAEVFACTDSGRSRRSTAIAVAAGLGIAAVLAITTIGSGALGGGSSGETDDPAATSTTAPSHVPPRPPVVATPTEVDGIVDLQWEGSETGSYYLVGFDDTKPGLVQPVAIVSGTEFTHDFGAAPMCFAVRMLQPGDDDSTASSWTLADYLLNQEGCVNGATVETITE